MDNLLCDNGSGGLAHKLVTSRRGVVRIAAIHDEEWLEGEPVSDPDQFVHSLRDQSAADLFSFGRPVLTTERYYAFPFEWDNVAVVRTSAFTKWWESLPQETRKNVRRSQRRGVTVSRVDFNDQLVRGIRNLYNEAPIRQGRKFWHYGKTFDQVKAENATYLDRSEFIGAFFDNRLVGFIKFVIGGNVARIMQILSMEAHADKRPTNALLAKAIELSGNKGATYLIYGKYVYGTKKNSPVTEFKRRNGFERLDFPRYYIPLTHWGAFAIHCGLHRGLSEVMPERIIKLFLTTRAAVYRCRLRLQERHRKMISPDRSLAAGNSSTMP